MADLILCVRGSPDPQANPFSAWQRWSYDNPVQFLHAENPLRGMVYVQALRRTFPNALLLQRPWRARAKS